MYIMFHPFWCLSFSFSCLKLSQSTFCALHQCVFLSFYRIHVLSQIPFWPTYLILLCEFLFEGKPAHQIRSAHLTRFVVLLSYPLSSFQTFVTAITTHYVHFSIRLGTGTLLELVCSTSESRFFQKVDFETAPSILTNEIGFYYEMNDWYQLHE